MSIEQRGHSIDAVARWALASVPIVWLLIFLAFLVRVRLSLGRWPAPYQPDPGELGFDLHYHALLAGLPMMFAAVLTTIVLALLTRGRSSRRWPAPLVAVASLAFIMLLARLDPGSVFTWLGD